jgi:hypothetical protein
MPLHNRDFNKCLTNAEALINYFSLLSSQQIEVLPLLDEKRCYDFPDGDLKSDNALLILAIYYQSYLNKLLLHLDDNLNPELENLMSEIYWVIDVMCNHQDFFDRDRLETDGWGLIRRLSLLLKQMLSIKSKVTQNSLLVYLNEGIKIDT